MPPKTKPPAPKEHILHHHRPVITMGLGISLLLAIGALAMANLAPLDNFTFGTFQGNDQNKTSLTSTPSTWPTYTHEGQKLTFRHPEEWQVTEKDYGDDTLITIRDKSSGVSKIMIFISPNDFLGFDGLKTTKDKLNGYDVTRVDNALFGIKTAGLYYTFDAGLSQESLPVFTELANSIKIE